ncbi:MAG: hypothetical protein HY403_08190 [Elusimicrobia bacterium]|nr:hypothetical protein [Elusimicrobiota bacterium]
MAGPQARLAPPRTLTGAFLLAAALAARPADAASIKLFAFDAEDRALDARALARRLSRADDKSPELDKLPLWAVAVEGAPSRQRLRLSQEGELVLGSWDQAERVRLELVWPVEGDGYNAVGADKGGRGFGDGELVFLDEEIAATQYARFKESWKRRLGDWQPLYKPGKKAKELAEEAKQAMASAAGEKEAPARGRAYRKSLQATALAWEKMLFEHGLQHARGERRAPGLRFGLTLDESLLKRLDDLDWIAEAVRRSGADWVRLVFRANPSDFLYSSLRSFNEYDGVVAALARNQIKIMGCVLDATQWPKTLTPELYAERVKNLVLHYRGGIASWEVGVELNGDWLGGAGAPFSPEQAYRVYAAGADKVKELDPELETVATLYAWEETAPDREHALSGWLPAQVRRGFGRNLDVVGLSVQPEDNPLGMGLERAFDAASEALPRQKLMLSSLGYVENEELRGYWWLAPDDVDGARKDSAILYATASCAMPRSLCGGFWWQTLDQMLPPGRRRATDLYKVWRRTLDQLGRRDEKN